MKALHDLIRREIAVGIDDPVSIAATAVRELEARSRSARKTYRTAQSRRISGLNASPWPGHSGATMVPLVIGTGSTPEVEGQPHVLDPAAVRQRGHELHVQFREQMRRNSDPPSPQRARRSCAGR